mgnify:CR=1 FL=1
MSVTVRDLNIAIGGAPIVRGVDLDIADAQRVGLVGASGSGKSMISKAMLGLLPTHAVVSGSVVMGGMETVGTDDRRLADIRGRYAGMVFQNPDNQIVANVVEEDVAFAPENLGVASEEIRRRVDDALAAVGMTEFARHAPHLLSGGQKQRVAIARMLMQQAPIMVFDDSLSAVDAETDAKIRTALRDTLHSATVLLISHRVTTLMQADRILVLDGGRVSALGTHRELIQQPGIYRDIYDIQMRSDDRALVEEGGNA